MDERRQKLPDWRGCRRFSHWEDYPPALRQAIMDALKIQLALLVLTALIMHPGPLRAFLIAWIGQLIMLSIVLVRRPNVPTRADTLLIRWGVLPLFALVICFI